LRRRRTRQSIPLDPPPDSHRDVSSLFRVTMSASLAAEREMDWILLVIIVGLSNTDRAVNSATVPMATAERCNAAKDQMVNSIKVYNSPNFSIIAECLRSR
jgi:hypothetical protein